MAEPRDNPPPELTDQVALRRHARPIEPLSPWLTGRLEAFIYSVSHDLGAPVRAVSVSLGLIAKHHAGGLSGKGQELLDLAVSNAGRLEKMVERLVSVSRVRRRFSPSPLVPLDPLVEAAIARHSPDIGALAATVATDPLPAVPGDEGQLKAMFTELLANALTFSRPDAAPHIEIRAVPQQHHILIAFRDNGQGVPANKVAQMFEPFARFHAPDAYPGMGLGLTLCREIAEVHRGFLYAYPNMAPDQGLTVIAGLPLRGDG